MVEPTVSDLSASIAWYAAALGLKLALLDEANGFALLEGDAGRISLKRGTPRPGGCRSVFEVPDLAGELSRLGAPAEAETSEEGYRSALLHDPDGNEIALFEWVQRGSPSTPAT